MNRVRPFANRLLKQKELEITDMYHDQNLKEMKPLTARLMQHSETITINNSKREMIKEVREQEIERENKLLLEKISNVITKKGNYSITKTKTIITRASKSLNEIARKKQLESIQMENKQMLTRLSSKRTTLNTLKFKKDWEDSRSLIKRMENCQFNMVYFKYREGVRSKKSLKITEERLEKINISQFRVINGQKMLIKVAFAEGFLNIMGDLNQRDLKFIKIPKQQAIDLIQSSCQGKLQKLLEKLRYDKFTSTLYIANQELGQDCFNPESIQTNPKKEAYKLKSLTHRVNKADFEQTPSTNKPEKDSIKHHESISHKATMLSVLQVKSQKSSQADEQLQNYQEQQFEQPIQEGKLTDKQIASIIGNQKEEPFTKKQADPPGAQILVEADEDQNYNDDFQKSQELHHINNLGTI